MQSLKLIALVSTASLLFGCCTSATVKPAATTSNANAIAADAKMIFKQTTLAVNDSKTIPVAKKKTTALNSLYAYHTIIAAYQGLTIPKSSIKTGAPAADVVLQKITSTKIPVTAKDVAAAKEAVVLAGGTP